MQGTKNLSNRPFGLVFVGDEVEQERSAADSLTFSELLPGFFDYFEFQKRQPKTTMAKDKECMGWVRRYLPHLQSPAEFTADDDTLLRKKMEGRGIGECRMNSIIFTLKKFLKYCRQIKGMSVYDPALIKSVKVPQREVVALEPAEIAQVFAVMDTRRMRDLRMRAICELLLSTGMRKAEALSLDRDQLDLGQDEAHIIGKGNKERTVLLNPRAQLWIKKYLARRKDNNPALFVTFGKPNRLSGRDISKSFRCYKRLAGLKKKFTPHTLRRTAATIMSDNGANVPNIQKFLGHSDPETTMKYYISVSSKAMKASHKKYLIY